MYLLVFWYARGGKERGRLICARSDTMNPGVRRRDAEGTPLVMPCFALAGQLRPKLAYLIRRSSVSLSLNTPQLFAALVFLCCANQEKRHTARKRRSGGCCCTQAGPPAVWLAHCTNQLGLDQRHNKATFACGGQRDRELPLNHHSRQAGGERGFHVGEGGDGLGESGEV